MSHRLFFLWFITLIIIPSQTDAYLDPGTGGLLYQIGFALFSLTMGWLIFPFRIIKEVWTRLKNRKDTSK